MFPLEIAESRASYDQMNFRDWAVDLLLSTPETRHGRTYLTLLLH